MYMIIINYNYNIIANINSTNKDGHTIVW